MDTTTPRVQFESALSLGDVWALDQIWREIGFDCLAGVFRRARFSSTVEQAIRVMVFNRLCDADSKLGTLRWLQTVAMPGVDPGKLTHQHPPAPVAQHGCADGPSVGGGRLRGPFAEALDR